MYSGYDKIYCYILPVVPTRRPVNGNALSHFLSMYKSILPRRAWKYTQFSKREGKNHHAKIPDAFLFPLKEGAVVTIVKTTIKAFKCFHLWLYNQYDTQLLHFNRIIFVYAYIGVTIYDNLIEFSCSSSSNHWMELTKTFFKSVIDMLFQALKTWWKEFQVRGRIIDSKGIGI